MTKEEFEAYLKDRYEYQIDWYNSKAIANQKIYRWMQWTVIVLAAITPVLIELKLEPLVSGSLYWPTLTAAVVAILTAGLKTFKYQENWIGYRTICETLRKEKYFYMSGIGEYGHADDNEALFVDRVEGLISRENTMWVNTQAAQKKSDQ